MKKTEKKNLIATIKRSTYKDVEELEVMKCGSAYFQSLYTDIASIKEQPIYFWTDQVLRSAESAIVNIAEAHGRSTKLALINCLRIARGSAFETVTHLSLNTCKLPSSHIDNWKHFIILLDELINEKCIDAL